VICRMKVGMNKRSEKPLPAGSEAKSKKKRIANIQKKVRRKLRKGAEKKKRFFLLCSFLFFQQGHAPLLDIVPVHGNMYKRNWVNCKDNLLQEGQSAAKHAERRRPSGSLLIRRLIAVGLNVQRLESEDIPPINSPRAPGNSYKNTSEQKRKAK
jgi:hypothetical protein